MSIDDLIHALEHEPDTVLDLERVRTPEVFDPWIRRCLEVVSDAPREGLCAVETAMAISTTSCQAVQCAGLAAAAYLSLGDFESAEAKLDWAFKLGRACDACQVDLLRRRGLLRASRGLKDKALADADDAITLQTALPKGRDHSLRGHGLAQCHQTRGDIRQHFGVPVGDEDLIHGALEDFSTVLILANPVEHSKQFGYGLLNLGIVLSKAGGIDNLRTANQYIRRAQACFRGRKHEASREKAHLDWQTAMVRFELRKCQGKQKIVTESLSMLRKPLERALSDFLEVGMPAEAAAVAADLALLAYPQRLPIMDLMKETKELIEAKWDTFEQDVRDAFQPVFEAMDTVRRAADADVRDCSSEVLESRMRATIERLREKCGEATQGQLLPCLLAWPPIESRS